MSKHKKKDGHCSDLFDSNGNKVELSEMGVSAKKAEASLSECCKNALGELGQAASVAVGCSDVGVPGIENEKSCEDKESKKEGTTESKTKSEKKSASTESDSKPDSEPDKSAGHLPLDLGVAGGLALLAVEKAGQVMHQATTDWEGKIDAVAEKAHATIETAQRAMKHPVGETMRKVDELKQSKKESKKAS